MEAYPADSYEDSNVGASAEDSYDEMVEGEQGSPMTPTHRQPQKNPKSSKEEIESGVQNIESEIQQKEAIPAPKYHYPPLKLLKRGDGRNQGDSDEHLKKTAQKLEETLRNFGVNVTVTNVSCGPTVTQYELQPEMGVKVSRIVSLADDIKLNLAAADIRIEAPIPGKAAVGIEVPNKENSPVMLRDLLQSQEFQGASSRLSFAVGKDIAGKPVVTDIAKMPHLLIAGSTGSGKSVCINTLIASILYKASPEEVKLIMIDPKVVELSVYNGIPHLLIPVVTDPKKAAGALNWAVQEMTQRYNTFAEFSVRKLEEYNHKVENMRVPEGEERPKKMPQIVVIVDELADLMMVAPGEVEDAIVRLTQLARAAGIHLVIATQRPSVNVITGLIKANMPSRIAFAVSSGTDSRVILDSNGAEKLLGKGDMLFYPQGYPKPARLQGAFISDEEVSSVVEFLSNRNPAVEYSSAIEEQVNTAVAIGGGGGASSDRDVYFEEAGKFIIEKEKASIGMLQRMFKIGFNRAARIMDQLCDAGVVGPEEGTKPRKVLMSQSEFESYLEEH
jgi:S-DNA-T family DNA segregation ATPase FtsK/SpoIIIE